MPPSTPVLRGQVVPAATAPITRRPIDHPSRPHGVVTILAERCKECEFCVHYCPKDVLEISPTFNTKGYRPVRVRDTRRDECIACRFCQDVCPEFAIFVEEAGA